MNRPNHASRWTVLGWVAPSVVGFAMIAAAAALLAGMPLGSVWLPNVETRITASDETLPDWSKIVPQPARDVTMHVVINSDRDLFDIAIDYVVVMSADDPLIDSIRSGDVDSDSIARYLAGGAANTPISLEATDGSAWVTARFRYAEHHAGWWSFDTWAIGSPAAAATYRRLTIDVGPGLIERVDPAPKLQTPRTAYLEGPPEPVYVDILADSANPSTEEKDDRRGPGWLGFLADIDPSWAPWFVVLLMPWLVVLRLTVWSRRGWLPALAALTPFAVAAPVAALGLAALLQSHSDDAEAIGLAAPPVSAVLIVVAAARVGGRTLPARTLMLAALVAGGCGALALAAAAVAGHADWTELVPRLAGAVLLAGGGAFAAYGRRPVLLAGTLGLLAGCSVVCGLAFLTAFELSGGALATMALGVAATGIVALATRRTFQVPRSPWAVAGLTVAGAFVFVSPVVLLARPADALSAARFDGFALVLDLFRLLGLGLAVGAVLVLRSAGRHAAALRAPTVGLAALVALLVATSDRNPYSWTEAVAGVALIVACWWIAPPARRPAAARLAATGAEAHDALVAAEARRRMIQASALELYRKARGRLVEEPADLDAYDRAQEALDRHARGHDEVLAGVPVRQAFATGGGRSPWQNGVRATRLAAWVGLLIAGYEVFASVAGPAGARLHFDDLGTVDLLVWITHLGRWFVYAFCFGYFYTQLRGSGPVVKAFAVAAALSVVEILPIFAGAAGSAAGSSLLAPASGRDLLTAAAVRAGQLVVFCTTLGFLWERALTNSAGYPWDRVRNVRSIRALAAPVSTVAIAVATAVGTGLAGAAVAALLSSNPGGQSPTPQIPSSPAASATPDHSR